MLRADDKKRLLEKHTRRLQKLREEEALRGQNNPPELLIEIEDIEMEIKQLHEELENLDTSNNVSEELLSDSDNLSSSVSISSEPAILIIDDDRLLCEVLQLLLTEMGFEVEVANDAITGLQKADAFKPDVILLDIMMPSMSAWQTTQHFREMSDAPIIMLTTLDSQEKVVKGLDLGAADYIVKPVVGNKLAARIRAVLLRAHLTKNSIDEGTTFTQGKLKIDFDKSKVTIDGEQIDLSPTEFRLLSVLARYKGQVLPHEFLLTEVWGPEYMGETAHLRLYISHLRRKLERDRTENLIQNEWGIGYRFG